MHGSCAGRVAPLWRKARFCRCAGGAGGAPLPGFRKGRGREWVTPNLGVRSLESWDTYRWYAFKRLNMAVRLFCRTWRAEGKERGRERDGGIRAESVQHRESKLNAQSNYQLNRRSHFDLSFDVAFSAIPSTIIPTWTRVTWGILSSIFVLHHRKTTECTCCFKRK